MHLPDPSNSIVLPLNAGYTGRPFTNAMNPAVRVVGFTNAHPTTRLVTIAIGANDVLLLQQECGTTPDCFHDRLPGQLATIADNVQTILSALRATGFLGVLMVVTYYSLDYTDQAATAVTAQLNQAITAHAPANGAVVADVFEAFKAAASTTSAGGKTCNAGLLNVDPHDQSTCDAHPSQSGHKLIAQTIESAYSAAINPSTATRPKRTAHGPLEPGER